MKIKLILGYDWGEVKSYFFEEKIERVILGYQGSAGRSAAPCCATSVFPRFPLRTKFSRKTPSRRDEMNLAQRFNAGIAGA